LQALGEVVVEVVPARLAFLSRTILLSGMISEQKPGGALVLRTQVGDLVIRSQTPLPTDKVLTLQIPPGAPPVRALVAMVQPPAAHASAPVTVAPAAQPAAATLPTSSPVPPPVGRVPTAPDVALFANAVSLAAVSEKPPLLPGSVIPAKVLALPMPFVADAPEMPPNLPAPVQQTVRNIATTGAPALKALVPQGLAEIIAQLPPQILNPLPVEVHPLPAPQPQVVARPAFASLPVLLTLPPGAAVTVQVERIFLPNAPVIEAPALAPTMSLAPELVPTPSRVQTFPAVVIGSTPKGEPIVTSPAGLLVLDDQAPLPAETKVEVSLVHVAEPPVSEEGEVHLPPSSRDWPVLQQIMAQTEQSVAALRPHLAKPEHVGSQTLFLLAAMGFKDVKTFVGDEVVKRAAPELLTRLATEMQQISQSWNKGPEAAPTEWRSLALPLPLHGEIQRLAIHTRREEEGKNPQQQRQGRRLVIEVELSRLGPLLLDGIMFGKRFDLTVRSQRRLPKSLRAEINSAWHDALGSMEWTGEIAFQTSAELWLGRN
jgi:hypothetical protein